MDNYTKAHLRVEVIEELQKMLQGLREGGNHLIVLNDYQVANLMSMIHAAGYGSVYNDSPLTVLNNGDWIGELFHKLPYVTQKPNASPEELALRAKNWKPR